ncbi:putative NUDIX hydrolase [Paratrimastix pyriformis]|uniref:NAD(+) diphosphatase n=1 Tax=Paratrimastix pyriformis TaxID=342808 RepID=A0ABQ8USK2_9EUKA|nr:putative NUDIX hydrolase [Paratrimastix pyriformis]
MIGKFARGYSAIPNPLPDDAFVFLVSPSAEILLSQRDGTLHIPTVVDLNFLLQIQQLPIRPIYLGKIGQQICIADTISAAVKTTILGDASAKWRFEPIRSARSLLDEDVYTCVWLSQHLTAWNESSRFCGYCGAGMAFTTDSSGTWCKKCTSPACLSPFVFPRTNPCIIASIIRLPDAECPHPRILLSRSRARPLFFSVNAGFVEACEPLEGAVTREIQEEVGLQVRNIQYFGSTSWAPSCSLMVAYTTEYAGGELRPDGEEIECAYWLTADEIQADLALTESATPPPPDMVRPAPGGKTRPLIRLPMKWSISRMLVDAFMHPEQHSRMCRGEQAARLLALAPHVGLVAPMAHTATL